ncbi:MAG: hypothetical protein ACOX2M_02810 [Fastidiosipilaceae bacterium]
MEAYGAMLSSARSTTGRRRRRRSSPTHLLRNRQGGVALEAAIACPLFIVLVVSLLMVVIGAEAEVVWRGASQKSCEEFALILAQTPELNFGAMIESEPRSTPIQDLTLTHLTGGVLLDRTNHWFIKNTEHRPWLRKFIINPGVYLQINEERYHIHIDYTFEIPTYFGLLTRGQVEVIPLWSTSLYSDESGNGSADEVGDDDDSIWSKGNFVRGRYFREQLGGSLPDSYPVISSLVDGTAVATKSIDLTSPYYFNHRVLEGKVMGFVNELSTFDGTERPWGNAGLHIQSSDIQSRKLIVVVPTNSSATALRVLNDLTNQAAREGVRLEVRRIGESSRYK